MHEPPSPTLYTNFTTDLNADRFHVSHLVVFSIVKGLFHHNNPWDNRAHWLIAKTQLTEIAGNDIGKCASILNYKCNMCHKRKCHPWSPYGIIIRRSLWYMLAPKCEILSVLTPHQSHSSYNIPSYFNNWNWFPFRMKRIIHVKVMKL